MLWPGRDREGKLLPFLTFVFGVCDFKTVGEVDDPDTSFADSWSSSPTRPGRWFCYAGIINSPSFVKSVWEDIGPE